MNNSNTIAPLSLCTKSETASRAHDIAIFLVFFLSGVAALIYQTSWSRKIGLLFGHTALASSIVLCAYFSGIAVGSGIGARFVLWRTSLKWYAMTEFVLAGWACLIPFILRISETEYLAAWLSSPSLHHQLATRFAFTFFLFLPAALALGATLPFMASYLNVLHSSRKRQAKMDLVSFAYSLNTLGGLVGIGVATFYLLPEVGVTGSSFFAAGISAFCGGAAYAVFLLQRDRILDHQSESSERPLVTDCIPCHSTAIGAGPVDRNWFNGYVKARIWLIIVLLSGFVTMSLEVLYIRLFALVLHNSTYTFGTVVGVFIASLAIGSAIASMQRKRTSSFRGLIGVFAGLGSLAVLISLLVFAQLTGLDYFQFGSSFSTYMFGVVLLVGVVVGPPIVCLGTVLPMAWQEGTCVNGFETSRVGYLTASNSLGSVAGIATTSFLLLPILDPWKTTVLVAFLSFGIATSLMLLSKAVKSELVLVAGALFCGLAIIALRFPLEPKHWSDSPRENIIRRWNSVYGLIDVTENRRTHSFRVRQNLHYRFGDTSDSIREARQSHIPLLLHPKPANVFYMGLGTGLTAVGALDHPAIERIVISELIPEVEEAARVIASGGRSIVDHPKVTMIIDDARHAMLANSQTFDVIISDLFVPWESETGYLYTVENYRLAKKRLRPGGLFCQWIPVYQLGEYEFELIANSMASVFPTTSLWWGNINQEYPMIAMIGAEAAAQVVSTHFDERLEELNRAIGFSDPSMGTPTQFHSLYIGDWELNSNQRNSDEHPRLEFSAPLAHQSQRLLYAERFRRFYEQTLALLPHEYFPFTSSAEDRSTTVRQSRKDIRWALYGDK